MTGSSLYVFTFYSDSPPPRGQRRDRRRETWTSTALHCQDAHLKKKADLGLILVWLRKGLKLVPVLPSLAAVSSVMDGEVSFCVTLTAASPFFLHSLL